MFKHLLPLSLFLACCAVPIASAFPSKPATQPTPQAAPTPTPDATSATFEVASIKKTDLNQQRLAIGVLFTYPGARVEARAATLQFLLTVAYNLPPDQIVGGPDWTRHTLFDIEARPPAEVAARYAHLAASPKTLPPPEIRQMLRNLLLNRFQLKLHPEQRQGRALALIQTGAPLRLTPSKDKNEFPWAGAAAGQELFGNGLRGINESMPDLAARLSRALSQTVVDRTNLTGSYDFEVAADATPDDAEDNILESLKDLGLELKRSTAPVQTIVIDHASQPTEN
ncbi:MAG: TIGR03435 family protein [Acidobacteriaceae bacterium]